MIVISFLISGTVGAFGMAILSGNAYEKGYVAGFKKGFEFSRKNKNLSLVKR